MLSDLPPNYTVSDLPSYDHAAVTKAFNALSANDKAKLSAGIARAISDTQTVPHIEAEGKTAAQAIKVIDDLLLSLIAKLTGFGDAASKVLSDCKSLQTNDAAEIITYLEYAEDKSDQDLPKYMKHSLDKGVVVYTAMAKYLKAYANEITV
ncbi:hypothetical protein C8R44DRAFT_882690 [Mycena epipterygia]|nr:hypothetical protein C8R44DRAFT_882690 [Mycena epipterygia]